MSETASGAMPVLYVSHGAPIACLKTALELMGICRHYTTAPLQPLSPEKREAVAAILRELELLA